jgi:HD superfamily phosphohydrolase YqeK
MHREHSEIRNFISEMLITPNKPNTSYIRNMLETLYRETDPYIVEHLYLAEDYAYDIGARFSRLEEYHVDKLKFAALSHDILKDRSVEKLDNDKTEYDGHIIPKDLNRYVRLNLDTLAPYGLDEYFNTDIQLHALAAGLFLIKELGIEDPQILYPVFFHSCPILDIYKTLDDTTQLMVDIITLSDKLSSNTIRWTNGKNPPVNLEKLVFGTYGEEFNFTAGVLAARLISQGKSTEKHSLEMTDFYYRRVAEQNPILANGKKCPSLRRK